MRTSHGSQVGFAAADGKFSLAPVDTSSCGTTVTYDQSPRFGSEASVMRRLFFSHCFENHSGLRPREQSLLADFLVKAVLQLRVTPATE